MTRIHYGTCPLCEAMCGIQLRIEGDRVESIRGDHHDPFSHGYVCPKVAGLIDVHEDPDRLRTPVIRRGGQFQPIEWDEAFDLVADRLRTIRNDHGRDAIAVYQGNPSVHNLGLLTYGQMFLRRLAGVNMYSATSADQLPSMLASLLMFGHQLLLPVPDVDHTEHFLIIGANPVVSNGSLMSAANMRDRIDAIRRRGGKVVVVNPRRTETAERADEHLFIRPGSDALFLLSVIHVICAEGLAKPDRLADHLTGQDELRAVAGGYPPERVADVTGVPADAIRNVARELAAADHAVAYGRLGVSTQRFGGLCAWLINALNILTGNFDRRGGAMFTKPALDILSAATAFGQRGGFARHRSRVSGLPEFGGELPVSVLAEEMETEGPGQIRALVTSAGNPALSTPNGPRLERALSGLDFMVSLDFYINETTRYADVILPGTFALERDHYDAALFALSVRNGAKYSPAVFERGPDQRHDWEIMMELASRLETPAGPVGHLVAGALRAVARRLPPRAIVALGLRRGPYPLTMKELEQHPHGIDLGPLSPRLPDVLRTPDRKICLAPAEYLFDINRLEKTLSSGESQSLSLIGRRQLRSNNSWMHNSWRLTKGKPRCTLRIHPTDAAARGLQTGASARVSSRVGSVEVPVEVSDEVMPGVVSLPHGWGHDRPGVRLSVAAKTPGVSANDLTDETFFDELSGNSGLSGVPVEVTRA